MEHLSEADEIIARQQQVAVFIQNHLRIVDRLSENSSEHNQAPLPEEQIFEVRDYQLDAWASIWEARQQGATRALVHLATGLGKTSIALFDVIKFREECTKNNLIPRVLFLSHRNEISEQAQDRFVQFIPGQETTYFRTRQEYLPDADVTFATFQAIYSELERFEPQDFEYIIYDEAHHSEAVTFKAVREHFDPIFELALTATPERMDEKDIKEYFGNPVYSKGLAEAMADGWLADVDYHIVFDDVVKQVIEGGFEPTSLKEFHELFKIRPRNEVIARNILEERHKIGLDDAKTVIFCEDVEHANEMAGLLEGTAYHSGITKSSRDEMMRNFRSGQIQVICTVDMFNEGIDIPDARLIVFLRSTQSGTIFEQQLGRGLRRQPGKDRVSVLDFVANIERIVRVREIARTIRVRSDSQTARDPGNKDDWERVSNESTVFASEHSSFDFQKLAIDLLNKYGNLQASPPPEGYISLSAFSTAISKKYDNLRAQLFEHGLAVEVHNYGGNRGLSLSPEVQEQLKSLNDIVDEAPEGWMSLNQFRHERGLSRVALMRQIDKFGIKLGRHRFGVQAAPSLSPQAQHELNEINTINEAPEGYVSANELAPQMGLTVTTLIKRAEELGIPVGLHKFPGSGKNMAARSFSPESALKLHESIPVIQEAPEDYKTIPEFGREIGITGTTLTTYIRKHGIPVGRHRFGKTIAQSLSPEAQQNLIEILRQKSTRTTRLKNLKPNYPLE